jgi:hypothetical protein
MKIYVVFNTIPKKLKENVINNFVLFFSIRMENLSIESNLFEDSEQLSAPLFTANSRTAPTRPTCVFVTIGTEKCFKVFDNCFCKGMGNLRLSEMLEEIRGTGVFKNLVQIISDISGEHSNEIRKEIFFLWF